MIQGLDYWLTTEPYDPYHDWCDNLMEELPDDIWESYEAWFLGTSIEDNWLEKLYARNMSPVHAAKIMARGFKFFKQQIIKTAQSWDS